LTAGTNADWENEKLAKTIADMKNSLLLPKGRRFRCTAQSGSILTQGTGGQKQALPKLYLTARKLAR